MTAPLVPADVDLQDFQYMPLDVRRLRDSDLAALESPEACWAAVLLWAASWHQVPAASLPDDDRVLANLSGYGRVVKEWQRIREGALRGWVKCDDGRLYHPVVAEKALEAWESKVHHAHGKLKERLRKAYGKDAVQPTFEQWVSAGKPSDWKQSSAGTISENKKIPPEKDVSSDGKKESSAGIPPENALKGEGEGKGYVNPTSQSVLCTQPESREQPVAGTRKGAVCGLLRKAGMADAAPHYLDDETWDRILTKRTDEEIVELAKAKMATRPGQRTGLKYIAPALLADPVPVAINGQQQPRQTQHQINQAAIAESLFGPQSGSRRAAPERLIEGEVIHG